MSGATAAAPMPSFEEFFFELWGKAPFPWQSMLASRVASQGWPADIDLPTASGKTACMDVALYALAADAGKPPVERRAPRRVWFVVDRRIVVDAAFERAGRIAGALRSATSGPLAVAAARLRSLCADGIAGPLAVARLRGGTWRDDGWARLPSQPAVICSTVDQLGSALLFRAYGHGQFSAPIWAGLAGNDSLVLLDEAHCAVPFTETLRAVSVFRRQPWAELAPLAPFHAISMSATPGVPDGANAANVFPAPGERAEALNCAELRRRIEAAKMAKLRGPVKGGRAALAEKMAAEAAAIARRGHRRIAVMVNRVATAHDVETRLREELGDSADVILLTGRMRPLDRDGAVARWEPALRAIEPSEPARPVVVVATQCLEVGADFSFDALVTECAGIDALRQRFGRLNRLGGEPGCAAAVLVDADDTNGKSPDPIYGAALARTWAWLTEVAGDERVFDFGIAAVDGRLARLRAREPDREGELYTPADHAPVLLPAHLDMLTQTGPRPAVEPEPALFLHGTRAPAPEARVVWRAGLPPEDDPAAEDLWAETLEMIPPSALEALAVPLPRLRRWLAGGAGDDTVGDVEGGGGAGAEEPSGDPAPPAQRCFGLWRAGGKPGFQITIDAGQIRADDTVILRASGGGVPTELGQSPPEPAGLGPAGMDLAERAVRLARGRVILRLQRDVLADLGRNPGVAALLDLAAGNEADPDPGEITGALRAAAQEANGAADGGAPAPLPAWLTTQLADLAAGFRVARLPSGGLLLTACRRVRPVAAEDDDAADPEAGSSAGTASISLRAHTAAVRRWAEAHALKCLPPEMAQAFAWAAENHDLGKLDRRFQLLLGGGEGESDEPLAKSSGIPTRRSRPRRVAPEDALPAGFRHEMLSLAIAEGLEHNLAPEQADLSLHLIASHHGHGRAFAPVVVDPAPEQGGMAEAARRYLGAPEPPPLSPVPAHQLGSGVAERFWRLTRRYGWWGLAYLETVLRLSDWQASSDPDTRPAHAGEPPRARPARRAERRSPAPQPVELSAIDGANPLGFLAAVGAHRLAQLSRRSGVVRLAWVRAGASWRPLLTGPASGEELLDDLESAPWAKSAQLLEQIGPDLTVGRDAFRAFAAAASSDGGLAAFAAAFGSDACVEDRVDRIQRTLFCFITGSGHQHFIGTIASLAQRVTRAHLQQALFGPWRREPGNSMRWDPGDVAEYALLAADPGPEGASAVWAANRLAVEALPLFPTAPTHSRLLTTGFTVISARREFTWPIWSAPIGLGEVGALLGCAELARRNPDACALRALGIGTAFRATRVRIPPMGPNFKTSFRPARAV
jgi:CRISPR-associated endonuclease/helicase Cas3